jgi:hypothetical protein
MHKKYIVRLTEEQRGRLQTLVRRGRRAHARKLLYARILLKADADGSERWTDTRGSPKPSSRFPPPRWPARGGVFARMGWRWRLCPRKPGRPRRRVLDGRAEAHLIALSCSDPPEGRERWSMRLLADRMVELGHVESVSYETVRRTLKKTASSHTSSASG